VIPLSGLLFAALGLAFTLRVPSMELFSYYFTMFLTPLFLFSDVFFPLEERLSGVWLHVAEVLPLLHPVRLSRVAFSGLPEGRGWGLVAWDVGYVLTLSLGLLWWARRRIRASAVVGASDAIIRPRVVRRQPPVRAVLRCVYAATLAHALSDPRPRPHPGPLSNRTASGARHVDASSGFGLLGDRCAGVSKRGDRRSRVRQGRRLKPSKPRQSRQRRCGH
jgi:ABC-2 type transporter